MLAAEVPKITDWMQAWGSLAGLVMSTAAVIFTGLLFRHEIKVRREEQRDSDAAQARLIVGEVTHQFGPSGVFEGVGWTVYNHSDAPVFELYVSVSSNYLDDVPLYLGQPNDYPDGIAPGSQVNGSWTFDRPFPEERWLPDGARVMVEFVDASGLTWKRAGSMSPTRYVQPSMPHTKFWPLLWEFLWPLSEPWAHFSRLRRELRRQTMESLRTRVVRRQAKGWSHPASSTASKSGRKPLPNRDQAGV
ncbi:hypothetical protein AB0M35_27570 [Micromonospora sp. NPDC051196]|uniref:hypothetical protein n=1 Tax=Micromonospora sp. NPDC051196 TaxID=3155281 RepID=UPI00343A65BC